MSITSPRWVTAGFFRVHLWVAMGLSTFACAIIALRPDFPARFGIAATAGCAALASYVGAVIWLYEKPGPGRVALGVVTLLNLLGAAWVTQVMQASAGHWTDTMLETVTAAFLLGSTFTAMLLGHWYLNTPTMKLAPLKQLIIWMVIAVILRCGVSWSDLGSIPQLLSAGRSTLLAFLALRWLAGLLGILGLSGMTWQTLKIPNTQSATGILYVAVIFAFLGELTAQLLSLDSTYPV